MLVIGCRHSSQLSVESTNQPAQPRKCERKSRHDRTPVVHRLPASAHRNGAQERFRWQRRSQPCRSTLSCMTSWHPPRSLSHLFWRLWLQKTVFFRSLQLPTCEMWFRAAHALHKHIMTEETESESRAKNHIKSLHSLLDINQRFSEAYDILSLIIQTLHVNTKPSMFLSFQALRKSATNGWKYLPRSITSSLHQELPLKDGTQSYPSKFSLHVNFNN